MASQIPVQTWGRLVSPNEDEVSALPLGEMPATISVTMAALDPGEDWAQNNGVDRFKGKKPRATIKMIVFPPDDDDFDSGSEEDDDDEDPDLAALLDEDDSDEDDRGEGPSDPAKSRKAKLAQELLGHEAEGKAPLVNGIKKNKGKGKAVELDALDDDEDDEDDSMEGELDDLNTIPSEFVLCTLDPDSHYQQPLNITISEYEKVFFRVEGTHSVHLTGNYLSELDGSDDDEDEYDLPPDEDELLDYPEGSEDESDELDDMDDPRIMEVDDDEDDDEEEAPKLVQVKGKNKRAAAEESDEDMADEPAVAAALTAADDKPLTKSQLKKMRKKLKDNEGNAVDATATAAAAKLVSAAINGDAKASPKSDKKVQFAKTLVQGPTGTDAAAKKDDQPAAKKDKDATKASLGVKTVDGVKIDDKKLGTGPAAKKGDKLSMRYIGKLDKDKRVFDSNKKGAPFTFKLGVGQVIKGWEIGLAGMSVGGERRITVPAHLAYGSKKMGDIPANSTLVFDVKLLEIK